DGVLLDRPLDVFAVFEHGNKDRRVRPGVVDALLPGPEIPDNADQGSNKSDQVEAQFDDLVCADMKAGNQEIKTDSKHSHGQDDKNKRTVVFMRAVIFAAAILVTVMTDHWAKLK